MAKPKNNLMQFVQGIAIPAGIGAIAGEWITTKSQDFSNKEQDPDKQWQNDLIPAAVSYFLYQEGKKSKNEMYEVAAISMIGQSVATAAKNQGLFGIDQIVAGTYSKGNIIADDLEDEIDEFLSES